MRLICIITSFIVATIFYLFLWLVSNESSIEYLFLSRDKQLENKAKEIFSDIFEVPEIDVCSKPEFMCQREIIGDYSVSFYSGYPAFSIRFLDNSAVLYYFDHLICHRYKCLSNNSDNFLMYLSPERYSPDMENVRWYNFLNCQDIIEVSRNYDPNLIGLRQISEGRYRTRIEELHGTSYFFYHKEYRLHRPCEFNL